jgi:hypothetical protein
MAAKKTSKPKAPKRAKNAAQAKPEAASAPFSKLFGRNAVPTHAETWEAKGLIQGMDLEQLAGYAQSNPGMIRNGRGVVAAIEARRAELSK